MWVSAVARQVFLCPCSMHSPSLAGLQIRDVDLDTLEKIVSIVTFGDIEAEDTRHLTELNFIKVFRLSQLVIEYLLYVQDCLQSTNTWLQQDRWAWPVQKER